MMWKNEQFEKFSEIEKAIDKYNNLMKEVPHEVDIMPMKPDFSTDDMWAYQHYKRCMQGAAVIELLRQKFSGLV